MIGTTTFRGLAVSELGALGITGLPMVFVEHPLGGERSDGVSRRARQATDQLAALIRGAGPASTEGGLREVPRGSARPISPETLETRDTPDAILAAFCEREWCDGLPIVPPTEERVRTMLGGAAAQRSLGAMPPLWRQATLEKLAVNAVMAGAEPSYFPVIVAAVQAMLDPSFNLYGVQATTHPVAPLLIVHGPAAHELGVHAGSGCFGPGFRANATIGRAIRLIMLNVGGAWPGRYDMATQGSPAKFSYCIAERDDVPWGPLHADRAVTVFGGEPPHNVNDHVSTTAAGILATVADTAVSLGSNVGWYFSQSQLLIVLGPEHARTIAGDGFSRADVQRFVFEHARLPLRTLKLGGMWGIQDWPRWMHAVTDDDALLPQVPSPEDVMVIVAGGPGKHSAVVPNCTFSRAVTRPIQAL
ncbi:MAG: hypothetical protein DME05_02080 [Candidatus Rokuibacteriota bacterium]|nr:MAG: hypothetical protein DME05_02080 [Candidatus Rokubacteria bacterium]